MRTRHGKQGRDGRKTSQSKALTATVTGPAEAGPGSPRGSVSVGAMAGKTAQKTPGRPFQLGPDPRRGCGKKGRSGRKPQDFVAWCHEITADPIARQVYAARNRAGDIKVMQFAAEYAHGKPSQAVEHSGDVTVRVQYDND